MKGCYCLTIHLKNTKKIKVGKLGKINFKNGYYAYVGSAMNSLESRLKRHLSEDFLETKTEGVKNFGCSDCDCESHLYYFKNRNEAIESVQNAYKSIAMDFEHFKI